MRLNTIKLAGFKSFVDPTTIKFVSNLTAVVGPNGCGKSNVIDAVRWVMGESSAKNLRSGALTDVIFTGSSTRKPVGQATVELVFDNVEGKLGGEYANYSEIAIKRLVTREGQSQYFLNNQRCRRKDITDIFLGTGLGPRSYAIIEQGMISKIIEAKPEELRNFIEEAAGVSKYKERRRETENRIKHTQDNLSRLNDLRDELDKQLRHLERQSQAAARYQELKSVEKTVSAELAAMAWKRIDREIVEHEQAIRESLVKLSEEQANAQQIKTAQEKLRLDQSQANEHLNEVQKQYYAVGAEIAKIEQALAHHQERREQLTADQQDALQTLQTTEALLSKDQEAIVVRQSELNEVEPLYEADLEASLLAQAVVEEAERNLESWRDKIQQHAEAIMRPTRTAEAEKAKITHLERQIHQIQERLKRLEGEYQGLQAEDPFEGEQFSEKLETMALQIETLTDELEALQNRKAALQLDLKSKQTELSQTKQRLHEAHGQFSAIETLQSAALGKQVEARQEWLRAHGMDHSKSVGQLIVVKSGWELAVETVLEGYLEAVGINENWENLSQELKTDLNCGIHLLHWQTSALLSPHEQSLVHQIENQSSLPTILYSLLSNVCIADDIASAQSLLKSLPDSMSVITQQGYWVGRGWIKLQAQSQQNDGILAREEKLKQLSKSIVCEEEKSDDLSLQIQACQELLAEMDVKKEQIQVEKNRLQQDKVALEGEKRVYQSRIDQSQKRRASIQNELGECQTLLKEAQSDINTSRALLQTAVDEMATHSEAQAELTQQKEGLVDALSQAKNNGKQISLRVNDLSLKMQTLRTQVDSLQGNVERFIVQISQVKQKLANIQIAFEKLEAPHQEYRENLEVQLAKRLEIEDYLSLARDKVAKIDNETRESEKQLTNIERLIEEWREKSERVKMQWQALSVHRENILEKLNSIQANLEEVIKGLSPEANETEWQQQLTDLEQKIQRLGAINLAAIEEFDAAKQRKLYLDSQLADLTEALQTLEDAIKKIDKETRSKFQETFDKINEGFQRLFPKLFGGGQAYLTMTGEDLLDTGITVMARPPGKKNSTIQLLSGGEKPLTAVALVFAIFELNPAPFCMLDEVDAPLDDNNVGRYCQLVKEMSSAVQMIFVSHNKLAIEIAEQLQGVTMREPGVSRLVTVDIEEAKSLVEA